MKLKNLSKLKFHFANFISISRLDRPIPILFLFLPCAWGLWFAYNKYISISAMWEGTLLFLLGSISARSLGCIINDVIDKDIDLQVERTKTRLIASGRVSIKYAIFIGLLWSLIGLYCFLKFNSTAQLFILTGLGIAVIYPFAKRFFKYPQIILGLGFNIGILVGYSAVYGSITNAVILLYVMGIYWTMIYDTIYAMQDIKDDIRLGLKSTAILYEGKILSQLTKFGIMMVSIICLVGWIEGVGIVYYILSIFSVLSIFLTLVKFSANNLQLSFYFATIPGFIIWIQILLLRIDH